jgi:hypothetical protein
MNAEERKALHALIDKAQREKNGQTSLQRSKKRNDEIVRQYVENGIRTEQIADLMQLDNWRVRQILRDRRIRLGKPRPSARCPVNRRRLLKVSPNQKGHRVAVPPYIVSELDPQARFTCELIEGGFRYTS